MGFLEAKLLRKRKINLVPFNSRARKRDFLTGCKVNFRNIIQSLGLGLHYVK